MLLKWDKKYSIIYNGNVFDAAYENDSETEPYSSISELVNGVKDRVNYQEEWIRNNTGTQREIACVPSFYTVSELTRYSRKDVEATLNHLQTIMPYLKKHLHKVKDLLRAEKFYVEQIERGLSEEEIANFEELFYTS